MWARIATFEGGDDERMRQMTEERGGMPDMPPGMSGAMVLRSSDGKHRRFIAWFDSKESIDAAQEHFEKMGDEMPEDVRGKRVSVEAYEVVFNSWEQ